MLELNFQVSGRDIDEIDSRAAQAVVQFLAGRNLEGVFDMRVRSKLESVDGIEYWEADVTWRRRRQDGH